MSKFNRYVVAFDKFKDCLTAGQLCKITQTALEKNLKSPLLKVAQIPLADGGDGFLEAMEYFFNSRKKSKDSPHQFDNYDLKRINRAATGPMGNIIQVIILNKFYIGIISLFRAKEKLAISRQLLLWNKLLYLDFG